jgi:hypothetical protein
VRLAECAAVMDAAMDRPRPAPPPADRPPTRQLNARGHTIVVVTHSPEVAAAIPRRIQLRDGQVERDSVDPDSVDRDSVDRDSVDRDSEAT